MVCERKEEAAEEEAEEERRDTESKTRTPHKDVVKKTLKFSLQKLSTNIRTRPCKGIVKIYESLKLLSRVYFKKKNL